MSKLRPPLGPATSSLLRALLLAPKGQLLRQGPTTTVLPRGKARVHVSACCVAREPRAAQAASARKGSTTQPVGQTGGRAGRLARRLGTSRSLDIVTHHRAPATPIPWCAQEHAALSTGLLAKGATQPHQDSAADRKPRRIRAAGTLGLLCRALRGELRQSAADIQATRHRDHGQDAAAPLHGML